MIKYCLLFCVLWSSQINAQSNASMFQCGTDLYNQMLKANTNYGQQLIQKEKEFYRKLDNKTPLFNNPRVARNLNVRAISKIDTISLVFHVVLPNALQILVTEEVINRQVAILNECFANENLDKKSVPSFFQPRMQTTGIRFAIAKNTEDNIGTNGTIRVVSNSSYSPYDIQQSVKQTILGGSNAWNTKLYLNVWITQLSNNIAGYSNFPYDNNTPLLNGIVVNYQTFSDTTVANYLLPFYNGGKTLVHEMGHFFGLRHIWADEDFCDLDDGFLDTPKQKSNNKKCPNFPSTEQLCDEAETSTMFMNFMDYSYDNCNLMFSKDQSNFMEAIAYDSSVYTTLRTSKKYKSTKYKNDILLKQIEPQIENSCEAYYPKIVVYNNGLVPIEKFDIDIFLDGYFTVTEKWRGALNPNDSLSIRLNTQLYPHNQELTMQLSLPNGVADEYATNNKQTSFQFTCLYLSMEENVVSYSASTNQIVVRHNDLSEQPLNIYLYDINGLMLKQLNVADAQAPDFFYINTATLQPEIYFVRLEYKSKGLKTYPIIIR